MPTQRENEIQLVSEAQKRGMTPDKIKEAVIQYRAQLGVKSQPQTAPTQTATATAEKPQGFGASVKEAFGQRKKQAEEAADLYGGKEQTLGESALQTAGAGLGFIGDVAFQGLRAITPKPVKEALSGATQAIAETPTAQRVIQGATQFAEAHPRATRNIKAGIDVLSALPPAKGASLGLQGVTKGVQTTVKGAEAVAKGVQTGVRAVKGATETAGDVLGVLKSTAKKGATAVKQAPMRLRTAAEKGAEEAATLAKQTPSVRKAVVNGIELRDAKLIETATDAEKEVFKDMVNQAKTYEIDRSSLSSADVAGNQLQKRVGEAQDLLRKRGAELGESVKGLKGEVVAVRQKILQRIREIPGLEDVRINNKGQLDFSKSRISQSLPAQKELNRYWSALKGRDAYRMHQLRQELFEILGGKKAGGMVLTASEEKAVNAIRQGIADALEEVSPTYKALNKDYAMVADPMARLNKFYKGLEGASDDILNEASGNLMRRLTSNAPSGSQLKQALNDLDYVLSQAGLDSGVNLQKLQEFQNALDRYYDIAKDTGFAGQVSLGVKKSGLMDLIDKGVAAVGDKLGASPEVKRKMIEELLGL